MFWVVNNTVKKYIRINFYLKDSPLFSRPIEFRKSSFSTSVCWNVWLIAFFGGGAWNGWLWTGVGLLLLITGKSILLDSDTFLGFLLEGIAFFGGAWVGWLLTGVGLLLPMAGGKSILLDSDPILGFSLEVIIAIISLIGKLNGNSATTWNPGNWDKADESNNK